MVAIGGTRRFIGYVFCVTLATSGLFHAQGPASGAPSLSAVVISQTLPGFVASPPGIRNGPIDASNLSLITGGSSSAGSLQFAQLLESGNVSGYVRSWAHSPTDGDGIVVSAFQFLDPSQAASFLIGSVPSATASFRVPNVPGATGFQLHTSLPGGTPASEYVVAFGKGNTDFVLAVVTESGDLTEADATQLASQQWNNVPTLTNWTPIVRVIGFFGAIAVSLIIVLVARRRRYPTALSSRPQGMAGVSPWALSTPQGRP